MHAGFWRFHLCRNLSQDYMEKDYFGKLPLSTLCEILSLLPSQQAFSLSTLSKSFRDANKELRSLHFESVGFPIRSPLSRGVTTILQKHPHLDSFYLRCFYNLSNQLLVDWATLLSNFTLTSLELHLGEKCYRRNSSHSIIPNQLLHNELLKSLKLSYFTIIQDHFELPKLETLHLIGILFTKGLPHLLSSCPNLQDLLIESLRSEGEILFPRDFRGRMFEINQFQKIISVRVPTYLISWKALTNAKLIHFNQVFMCIVIIKLVIF